MDLSVPTGSHSRKMELLNRKPPTGALKISFQQLFPLIKAKKTLTKIRKTCYTKLYINLSAKKGQSKQRSRGWNNVLVELLNRWNSTKTSFDPLWVLMDGLRILADF